MLARTAAELKAAQVRFAVVGGLAVSARCEPRFTRDVDLAVAVASDKEAEAVVHSLIVAGYRHAAQLEHEDADRLTTTCMRIPDRHAVDEPPIVDLLFDASGIEKETVDAATIIDVLRGIRLPVARVPHLIAMKSLSVSDRRPQDAIDLTQPAKTATKRDFSAARRLIDLIIKRNHHRERDLHAILNHYLRLSKSTQ